MEGENDSPGMTDETAAPPRPDSPLGVEQSPQRVTAEDVRKAEAEQKETFSKLMDDMEASVASQGQWFVKLGDKKPITETQQTTESRGFLGTKKTTVDREVTTGYDDSRVLVLRAISTVNPYGQEQREFTVVTPDGFFVAPFYTSELDDASEGYRKDEQAKFNMLKELTTGAKEPTEEMQYSTSTADNGNVWRRVIQLTGSHNRDINLDYPNRHDLKFSLEDFQRRIQESIALTETPHKANAEAAQAQTELATSAADMIRTLPPRP